MSDEIRPVGGVGGIDPARERREGDRRREQRRKATRDLVPVGPAVVHAADPASARAAVHPAPEAGSAAFFAQQMGQSGQKRGLKAGPPTLGAARAAYLGREYSGSAERRPPAGKATDTDI